MLISFLFVLGILLTVTQAHFFQPSYSCNKGYEPSRYNPRQCVDIDECASGRNPCQHFCVNSQGSFECSCKSGFVVSRQDNTKCVASGGSSCRPGYKPSVFDPDECEDIDECADQVNRRCEHVCVNSRGSFECSCNPGYVVSKSNPTRCVAGQGCRAGFRPSIFDPDECEDIDECATANGNCQDTCTNSRGSYECSCKPGRTVSSSDPSRCVVVSSCKSGFRPSVADPRECEDIDECAIANGNCQDICTNSRGSYECSCRPGRIVSSSDPSRCVAVPSCNAGFRPSVDPRECEDIDECATANGNCQHICTNKRGSYECSCRAGYTVSSTDSSRCVDINECTQSLGSPCAQFCTNTDGGYTCSCRPGYRVRSSDAKTCEDIDECLNNPSPCQQICINTDGGYSCSCNPGSQVSPTDNSKCIGVDPCNGNPCAHKCTPNGNSYTCSCRSGYKIKDVTKCEDINECTQSSGSPCAHNCRNTDGGYECYCKTGYRVRPGDITKCDDINECNNKPSPCQHICTNTGGDYICSCNDGYEISSLDKNKCQAKSDPCKNNACEQDCAVSGSTAKCICDRGYSVSKKDPNKCDDNDECLKKPCQQHCQNTIGSYTCTCDPPLYAPRNNKTVCIDPGPDPCNVEPKCKQLCKVTSTGRMCYCNDGFVINEEDDRFCDEIDVCEARADIILIFDASKSIGVDKFNNQFVFAIKLIKNFNVESDNIRFGGVVFSEVAKRLFNLKDYDTQAELTKALTNVTYMNSVTFTHEALLLVDREEMFSSEKGGRADAPKIILIFTDGSPSLRTNATLAANVLKNKRVSIIILAIGQGSDLKVRDLYSIASSQDDVLLATDYDSLDTVEKKLTSKMCTASSRQG